MNEGYKEPWYNWLWLAMLHVIAGALMLFGGIAIVMSSLHDGRVDYCYIHTNIQGDVPTYRLYEHRPWSQDTRVGAFTDVNTAIEIAQKINCPLSPK